MTFEGIKCNKIRRKLQIKEILKTILLSYLEFIHCKTSHCYQMNPKNVSIILSTQFNYVTQQVSLFKDKVKKFMDKGRKCKDKERKFKDKGRKCKDKVGSVRIMKGSVKIKEGGVRIRKEA